MFIGGTVSHRAPLLSVALDLRSEDVLTGRRRRPRETGRRLVRVGIEALGGGIIEGLELIILTGRQGIECFLCT